jgi:hypothetical protein
MSSIFEDELIVGENSVLHQRALAVHNAEEQLDVEGYRREVDALLDKMLPGIAGTYLAEGIEVLTALASATAITLVVDTASFGSGTVARKGAQKATGALLRNKHVKRVLKSKIGKKIAARVGRLLESDVSVGKITGVEWAWLTLGMVSDCWSNADYRAVLKGRMSMPRAAINSINEDAKLLKSWADTFMGDVHYSELWPMPTDEHKFAVEYEHDVSLRISLRELIYTFLAYRSFTKQIVREKGRANPNLYVILESLAKLIICMAATKTTHIYFSNLEPIIVEVSPDGKPILRGLLPMSSALSLARILAYGLPVREAYTALGFDETIESVGTIMVSKMITKIRVPRFLFFKTKIARNVAKKGLKLDRYILEDLFSDAREVNYD